jgi:hypothetical protein
VSLICHAFQQDARIDQGGLHAILWDWSKLVAEKAGSEIDISIILEGLTNNGVLVFDEPDYTIDIKALPHGICALYFDLIVRGLASETDVRDYIVGLLELDERGKADLREELEEAER